MANSSSYRVKLDLSEFYSDVRKLSYVLVDEQNVSHILHLQQRIKVVFGMNRPFYFTSNDGVYLPPNEDVRIIREGETIVVCPGPVNPDSLTVWKETEVKCNGMPLRTIQVEKVIEMKNQQSTPIQSQIVIDSDECDLIKDDEKNKSASEPVIVTESEGPAPIPSPMEDSDTDISQDQKNISTAATPDLYIIPRKKRKRVRNRKAKKSAAVAEPPKQSSPLVQPILLNSSFTPKTQPKHFKFNWEDNDVEDTKGEVPYGNSQMRVPELNTLLSLKNSDFPLTFVGHKTTPAKMKSKEPDEPLKVNNPGVNGMNQSPRSNGHSSFSGNSSKDFDFSKINPLNYPILDEECSVGDIVAFRILKMGVDYSPEVSGYIVAETVSTHPEQSTYSFKIMSGNEHLKDPEGKFSITPEEEMESAESEIEAQIYVLARAELFELRLICSKSI